MTQYLQLAEEIRQQVRTGTLQPGDRLPSFAEVRRQSGFNQNTIEKAHSLLEQEGLIERRPRRGIFIREPPTRTRTGLIGFIGSSFSRPYLVYDVALVAGMQTAAERHQCRIVLLGDGSRWDEAEVARVDGVLAYASESVLAILDNLPADLPRVTMVVPRTGVAGVVIDDVGGYRSAVQHLAGLGHRRIACLLEINQSLAPLRHAGYLEGLREAHIEPDARCARLLPIDFNDSRLYVDWGLDQMRRWLREDWMELGCTAIVAQNDRTAAGIMQALQEAGIEVPHQVSVMGFDGTDVCNYTTPRLTSVASPLQQIAERAVDVLEEQVESGKLHQEIIVLPTGFRPGGTTAPPAGRRV